VRTGRTALVHDYMTQLGGAERVAGILANEIPDARLLTSVHLPAEVPLRFIGGRAWQTSFLQPVGSRLPLKTLLPLLPAALASLDVGDRDLVISSSSAFAHHVRAAQDATHVCFCATPAHFLWGQDEYFRGRPALRRLLAPLLRRLRGLDLEAAARVDAYIAISRHIARRIEAVYGRKSRVVYPPVDVARFRPSHERSGRFLVVSRLVRTKHVDLAIEAANRFELPLDVIGKGPEIELLRTLAGPSVRVHGWQPDDVVRRALAECTAVVIAGEEDFGLVTAEAQASGRPPVAFAGGGAPEIIEDGVTGYLFHAQTPAALGEAMLRARERELATADLVGSAARFDLPVFRQAFREAIEAVSDRPPAPIGARSGIEVGGR